MGSLWRGKGRRYSSFIYRFGLDIEENEETPLDLSPLKTLNPDDLDSLVLDNELSNEDLSNIKGLTGLKELSFGSTNITDAGLVYLQGLKNLKMLTLACTKITDAGLFYLQGLNNLKELNLRGTGISDDGIKKLQQALPNCEIGK